MKRIALYVVSVSLIVAGAFLLLRLYNTFKPQQTGALAVTANIESDVYLDGELVGQTPFCSGDVSICSTLESTEEQTGESPVNVEEGERIVAGEHTIKITPKDSGLSSYVVNVNVHPGVLTAVERTFLPDGLSSAFTLTLEEKSGPASLFVQSIPSNAVVSIDGVASGVTPHRDDDISESEHLLEIQKDGFAKKTIRVRAVEDYLLVVNVILGVSSGEDDGEIVLEDEEEATESAQLSTGEDIVILDTPTGFLRVRAGPGIANDEILQVSPGDTFPLLSESNGWYEIGLDGETVGWITQDYAEKIGNEEED